MKFFKILLSGFFVFILTTVTYSQNNKLSVDLNLPVPVGDNFIGKNYQGIVDVGIKYHFIRLSKLGFGLSSNIGLLHSSRVDVNAIMIKPRISGEISLWRLKTYIGLGYSIFLYDVNMEGVDNTNDGFNMNFGLKFNIISKLYINLGYDFIKFRTEKFEYSDYNSNIQILEIGLGVQF